MLIFGLLCETTFRQVIDHVVCILEAAAEKILSSSLDNISSPTPPGVWLRINENVTERPRKCGLKCVLPIKGAQDEEPGQDGHHCRKSPQESFYHHLPQTGTSQGNFPNDPENSKLGGNISEEELGAGAGDNWSCGNLFSPEEPHWLRREKTSFREARVSFSPKFLRWAVSTGATKGNKVLNSLCSSNCPEPADAKHPRPP